MSNSKDHQSTKDFQALAKINFSQAEEIKLKRLKNLKDSYQVLIQENFEHKAKSCLTCETKGACCLDEHFVNVHITELEAKAIIKTLAQLNKLEEVLQRTVETIRKYKLSTYGDTFRQTFACPLFEKENGCLVHGKAKPIPCISHACYENKEDLPPIFLQSRLEKQVEDLHEKEAQWQPLPLALKNQML
jgi:hypothetical protein